MIAMSGHGPELPIQDGCYWAASDGKPEVMREA